MKWILKITMLAFCVALALAFFSCSNGSDSSSTISTVSTGVENTGGGGTTVNPEPTPEPVYKVKISSNEHGTISATPATGVAGTEITLAAAAGEGYELTSYSVTDADGNEIAVTDGKFIMPESHVTVVSNFTAINYTIYCVEAENGNVTTNCTTATIGTSVTLTLKPDSGYRRKTIVVNGANNSNITVNGKGNERTFIMPAQNVTINATFVTIPPEPSGEYTELPLGTTDGTYGTSGSYVTFGLWPQSIADDDVVINENDNKTVGAFVFCKGDDGAWYVKTKIICTQGGNYSDESAIKYNEERWFKVEPVKWRVVTADYGGKKLLLAEKALQTGIPFYLEQEGTRSIGGTVVYPNNYKYSTIRAFLNGAYEAGDTQAATYADKGFLQTAFTQTEQEKILKVTIDNSVNTIINTGKCMITPGETYVCDNSDDKIFLLSESEITNDAYGFENNVYLNDNGRSRKPTDFAMANNCILYLPGQYTAWWLRSPSNGEPDNSRYIWYPSDTYHLRFVAEGQFGIVPALCVSN